MPRRIEAPQNSPIAVITDVAAKEQTHNELEKKTQRQAELEDQRRGQETASPNRMPVEPEVGRKDTPANGKLQKSVALPNGVTKEKGPTSEPGAEKAMLCTFSGHRGAVNSVAFTPDSKTLAVSSSNFGEGDGEIKVWDTNTKQELFSKSSNDEVYDRVVFSPDGKQLAAVSRGMNDGHVRFWDMPSGKERATLRSPDARLLCIAFSPDARFLAGSSANYDASTITVWNVSTGHSVLRIATEPTAPGVKDHWSFLSVVYSPDGKRIASANSTDSSAAVWSSSSGKQILSLKGHAGSVVRVTFSPDGKQLLSVANDVKTETAELRVWDALVGRELFALHGHIGLVWAVSYCPNRRCLVSASGKTLYDSSGSSTGGWGEIKIWDSTTGRDVTTVRAHSRPVTCLAFDLAGKSLASGSGDKTVVLWDVSQLMKSFPVDPAIEIGRLPETIDPKEKASQASSEDERKAAQKLNFAKILQNDGKTDIASSRFEELIKDYPNTKAAKEARHLLKELKK